MDSGKLLYTFIILHEFGLCLFSLTLDPKEEMKSATKLLEHIRCACNSARSSTFHLI